MIKRAEERVDREGGGKILNRGRRNRDKEVGERLDK